jgi:hypothetical protein
MPNSPVKPIRLWMEVGDRDNGGRDVYHDWVVANENMAKVLAEKGYRYQFVFSKNAGHVDKAMAKVKFLTSPGMDVHVVRHPINPCGAPGWTRTKRHTTMNVNQKLLSSKPTWGAKNFGSSETIVGGFGLGQLSK